MTMKARFNLFLRGFILAACTFLLINLGKFDEVSTISLVGMISASLLIGYCSMRFAPKFWRDFGFNEKAFN